MACFASEAELQTFLGRLDPDYSQFASTLWQNGVRTACQLANTPKPLLLSWGLPELYINDIKATADTTGELNALNACTVCLIVHRCCVHLLPGFVCTRDWVICLSLQGCPYLLHQGYENTQSFDAPSAGMQLNKPCCFLSEMFPQNACCFCHDHCIRGTRFWC